MPSQPDPVIDEVRAIRQALCEVFDYDLRRLTEHLREVEREYRSRSGIYANIPTKSEFELESEKNVE
jgi:hypothetical protein